MLGGFATNRGTDLLRDGRLVAQVQLLFVAAMG
jgi:hypothetical protein